MRSPFLKLISTSLILLLLNWGLTSCGDRIQATNLPLTATERQPLVSEKLSEVAPPTLIRKLEGILEQYHPQVTILNPLNEQIIQDTSLEVRLKVEDLPVFKTDLGLGPHLHLILDNEPYQSVYDLSQPVRLENLTPGTHTLRVFPVTPWDESFKNDGAYAQATFHIFSKNGNNAPAPNLPLLTYSHPQGEYGAEPILLDFYLTNAPLHIVAQESSTDEIADWRIRVTINGESFLLDRWQSLYLKGFNPGENWVQLEFIDENGNKVDNVFNNTVRVITYHPNGEDTLSRLVLGELSEDEARTLVSPNYKIPPVVEEPTEYIQEAPNPPFPVDKVVEPEPEVVEEVTPEPEPEVVEEVTPEPEPEVVEEVTPEPEPEVVEEVTPEPEPEVVEEVAPEPEPEVKKPPSWVQNLRDRVAKWKSGVQSTPLEPQSPNRKIIPVTPSPASPVIPEPSLELPEIELPERLGEPETEIPTPAPLPQRPAIPKFI
jgi:hypothetical protein